MKSSPVFHLKPEPPTGSVTLPVCSIRNASPKTLACPRSLISCRACWKMWTQTASPSWLNSMPHLAKWSIRGIPLRGWSQHGVKNLPRTFGMEQSFWRSSVVRLPNLPMMMCPIHITFRSCNLFNMWRMIAWTIMIITGNRSHTSVCHVASSMMSLSTKKHRPLMPSFSPNLNSSMERLTFLGSIWIHHCYHPA